jgi:hypothetical protein
MFSSVENILKKLTTLSVISVLPIIIADTSIIVSIVFIGPSSASGYTGSGLSGLSSSKLIEPSVVSLTPLVSFFAVSTPLLRESPKPDLLNLSFIPLKENIFFNKLDGLRLATLIRFSISFLYSASIRLAKSKLYSRYLQTACLFIIFAIMYINIPFCYVSDKPLYTVSKLGISLPSLFL